MHSLMVQVGAWLMHLFMVQVDYRLFGTGWCMVDALVYGRLVQMHLFIVQVEVQVDAWLMHGSGYWYRLFGAG
jgi:hypothetical protein